jgi:hypothetical protein
MKTPCYIIDNLHEQFPDDNACLGYIQMKHPSTAG